MPYLDVYNAFTVLFCEDFKNHKFCVKVVVGRVCIVCKKAEFSLICECEQALVEEKECGEKGGATFVLKKLDSSDSTYMQMCVCMYVPLLYFEKTTLNFKNVILDIA